MGIEIERKFLVVGTEWRTERPEYLCQAYLNQDPHRTVRVRLAGTKGYLTIKGLGKGIERPEFEYEIPADDARQLLSLADGVAIEKKRHKIIFEGMTWEVDEFLGSNAGLVVAEIELTSATQSFGRPNWLGAEVSHDDRYRNSQLVRWPFQNW